MFYYMYFLLKYTLSRGNNLIYISYISSNIDLHMKIQLKIQYFKWLTVKTIPCCGSGKE